MAKESTGLHDKHGKVIYMGDTVKGPCYDKEWTEVVRDFRGYLIPFECPDVSQFIQIKASECRIVKRGE